MADRTTRSTKDLSLLVPIDSDPQLTGGLPLLLHSTGMVPSPVHAPRPNPLASSVPFTAPNTPRPRMYIINTHQKFATDLSMGLGASR